MQAERNSGLALVGLKPDQRSNVLSRIRRAKSSHIRWRAFAQGLVAGVEVSEEKLPIRHTDCQFGQWYHSEGKSILGHLEIFRHIDGAHEMLHSIYEQIYNLVRDNEMEKARKKLDELIGVSRTLLEQIELLESEVDASF